MLSDLYDYKVVYDMFWVLVYMNICDLMCLILCDINFYWLVFIDQKWCWLYDSLFYINLIGVIVSDSSIQVYLCEILLIINVLDD